MNKETKKANDAVLLGSCLHPKPPLCRIIRDYDPFYDKCPLCESSMKSKFLFWKAGGCIQPKCDNYGG